MYVWLSAAATLVLVLAGCAAGRHPPPLPEPAGAAAVRRDLSSWAVGVREPEVRYSEPNDPGPDVSDEVRDAAHLIEALRGTRLFAEVDFTEQLACEPQIELVVLAREGERIGPGPLWLWVVTLSIVIRDDEGIAFAPADDPDTRFDFPYPTTLFVGIAPLVASPVLITGAVPTWSLLSTGNVDEELGLFLVSNADRLEAFARDSAAETCPRR